jgi:hypothetical protein
MTYAEAIEFAAGLCGLHNRDDVAAVLRSLPQMRIAANVARMNKKLAAAGMDLQSVLNELKTANEGDDREARIRARARFEIATEIMNRE